MPRIDPLQLLKCLSVLLSPEGGILSRDEVPRLVNLMTKFSKKLVSKCVYVLILKNTETSLVDMFMAEGGWTLIQSWLQDAAQSGNWDLVKEILGLLLITPVDVERLKMNCLPKLIKNLSRREDLDGVAQLSNQIVQNWLIIVKGSAHNTTLVPTSIQSQLEKLKPETPEENEGTNSHKVNITESLNETRSKISDDDSVDNTESINTNKFYKASLKESKHTTGNKISSNDDNFTTDINSVEEELKSNEKDSNEKDSKLIEKEKERTTKPSSSSKSRSGSSSSRDKEKDKDKKRSSHSSSSKSKSSSSCSSRDKDKKSKDKDRDKKDKDRHRHSSSSKSGSSKSSSKDKKEPKEKGNTNDLKNSKEIKDYKEKQAEKDKDTLQKIKPHTLDKLGRIPKKSSSLISDEKEKGTDTKSKENGEKDLAKKPSFSILNRKASGEERSKTVKVFNSKMRSTGLEEEVKPPPPRSAKKPNPSVQLPTIPQKRPSPPREPSSMPPEKKIKVDKLDVPERPGSIKLIPPKPKPPVLQESDMFMDALTASAPKKEAKKRKRRLSITKDAPLSPSLSPAGGDPPTPTSPTPASPTPATQTSIGLKNIAPINFYQDTLSEEPEKNHTDKKIDNNDENENNTNSPDNDTPASSGLIDAEPLLQEELDPSPPKNIKYEGLKGVLLYTKKKGPKRSIKWKCEDDLVEIRYFELDETERVNVTKTFGDLAKMDISSEREALIMSRKTPNEDLMEPQIMWRMLYVCEQPDHLAPPGSKSLEKDIQFAREKTALPTLYYDKRRIPDSPEEPIPENHQMSDPVIIPLEDPESQEIDLRSTPWPEPKGPPPQVEPQPLPPMFQNIPFNPNFNNLGVLPPSSQFVGVPPRFSGPGTPLGPMSAGPGAFVPPNMMHNNMMGPPLNQPEIMNQGPINPVMFGPGPDGFIGPGNDPNFQMQQFNGPQGPSLNMYGQNNFHHRGGEGDGRGGYRRGGGNNGGWVRMNGPRNNWKRGRGGNSRGGRMCKNIQNHGYCRNGDNCPFIH